MDFRVVIPARYGSSRFPGKPLARIGGKPMVQRVYERAISSGAVEVVVATDDERIRAAVEAFGGSVCMTRSTHQSGTDRIAEVADIRGWPDDLGVVNLQGDEPTMPAALVAQVAADLEAHPEAGMSTLSTPIRARSELFNPHVVKVVSDLAGYALYFSRAPIPWHRDELAAGRAGEGPVPQGVAFERHIGLYAYRVGFLKRFVSWAPAPIEQAESLEQLRVLWHGGSIHVSRAVEPPGIGVDTPEDLREVEALLG